MQRLFWWWVALVNNKGPGGENCNKQQSLLPTHDSLVIVYHSQGVRQPWQGTKIAKFYGLAPLCRSFSGSAERGSRIKYGECQSDIDKNLLQNQINIGLALGEYICIEICCIYLVAAIISYRNEWIWNFPQLCIYNILVFIAIVCIINLFCRNIHGVQIWLTSARCPYAPVIISSFSDKYKRTVIIFCLWTICNFHP